MTRASSKIMRKNQNRHYIPTIIYSSLENENLRINDINIVLDIIKVANQSKLVLEKDPKNLKLYNKFPGEHYRLINALVKVIKPEAIVEIGTDTGLSAKAMLEAIQTNRKGKLLSYDIIPIQDLDCYLTEIDLSNGLFEQRIADLSDDEIWAKEKMHLDESDVIFIDGPKNGLFEYDFIRKLTLLTEKKRIIIIDDIKFMNMINLWNSIQNPKIDLSSFGHFTGTGLVFCDDKLKLSGV